MNQNSVSQLPPETVKLITSTQIVTSVSTAVKELLENSIDAGAKVIEVKLENYGLDLIEVKDDGCGVSYDNVQRMFLPGYTSKIRQFEDLDKLQSYGFRGEALAAIVKIAKVSVTTKTIQDTLAMSYDISACGLPLSSKPSHLNRGTVITVTGLFSDLPVRRLYLSSKKKMAEELKKVEVVVQSLSLIHTEIRVSLIHNKCVIWKKNSVKGIRQSFMQVVGLKTASKMDHINELIDNVEIDLIIPKKDVDNPDFIFTNSPHSIYVYVNKRPINCNKLSGAVQEHIFHHFSIFNNTFKYAVCLISVNVPPGQIDINLEPNKTKVLLRNQQQVIQILDKSLSNYYCHENFNCTVIKEAVFEETIYDQPEENQAKRPRLDLTKTEKIIGDKRSQEFMQKNQDWNLEIINDDCVVNCDIAKKTVFEDDQKTSQPQSLCSQINSENCILATEEEISELNAILNDNHHKLVTSTNNKNCEIKLIDRNDIQEKKIEKPIIQDWPCRPKVSFEPPQKNNQDEINNIDFSLIQSTPSEILDGSVEDIVKKNEKEEKWNTDITNAIKDDQNEEFIGETSNMLLKQCEEFDCSMQSVSSQMGKKEMKAFTKFARIMRPKIIKEFPNIPFTQVATILAERWRNLSTDEVKYYQKMADIVDINRKTHQEEKQNQLIQVPEKPAKQLSDKGGSIKSLFDKTRKKKQITRPIRKEVLLEASLEDVKKLRNFHLDHLSKEDYRIIGQLQPSGNWLYIWQNKIGHVRHKGLQELIISQKMLSNHSVARKILDKPIVITKEIIGDNLWNTLSSLESEYISNCTSLITSDVITKNGFSVEISKKGDSPSGRITEVAESIPHYGVSELKDILNKYEKYGEIGGLASWRPTSVVNYIANEAIRLVEESQKLPDREEIEEMVNTYHLCLRHLPPYCLHSKEIFVQFFQFEESSLSSD